MFCFVILDNKRRLLDVRFSSKQGYNANNALEGYAKSLGGEVVEFASTAWGGEGKVKFREVVMYVSIEQSYLSTDSED